MNTDPVCYENTDVELWREDDQNFLSPRIFVTAGGGIGIDVAGRVIVKPVREWHKLATDQHPFVPKPQ